MGFDKKKYLIDGRPVTPSELIEAATWVDERFNDDWFKSTSAAASILRDNGHVVEDNPDCSP